MQILKGAPVAAAIRDEIKKELEGCEIMYLAIVRVGENKRIFPIEDCPRRMSGVGIETKLFVFPADISMDDFQQICSPDRCNVLPQLFKPGTAF